MADWKDWLNKGKQWVSDTAGGYQSAGNQASGLGAELGAKAQQMDENRKALSQDPGVAPSMVPAPASPVSPTDLDQVNPGYQPIGGQNAVDQLYAGKPPALLPSPATKRSFSHAR